MFLRVFAQKKTQKRRKWVVKKLWRSPTNAGGAGGLPVLNAPVGSEGDRGPKEARTIIYERATVKKIVSAGVTKRRRRSPKMSPAEPKNVAGGAHKCRWRSPKISPAELKNVAGGAQKCGQRNSKLSLAELKNVAGGTQ